MSKLYAYLPEDFIWYTKERKEGVINSLKDEYGDDVTILPFSPNGWNHRHTPVTESLKKKGDE